MIKKRIKSDQGAAILILGIFTLLAIMIMGGLLVDVGRTASAVGIHKNNAAMAAKSGIRMQTGKGGLSYKAGDDAVRFYQERIQDDEFLIYSGGCHARANNSYPKITVSYIKPGKTAKELTKTAIGPNGKLAYTVKQQQDINNGMYDTIVVEVEDCKSNLYRAGDSIMVFEQRARMLKGASGEDK